MRKCAPVQMKYHFFHATAVIKSKISIRKQPERNNDIFCQISQNIYCCSAVAIMVEIRPEEHI